MAGELDVLYDGTGILKDIAIRRGPVRRVGPFTVVFGARNDTQKTLSPWWGRGERTLGYIFLPSTVSVFPRLSQNHFGLPFR